MPYQVVVIGAGFGGIGMAIALKQAGIEDFVVVDRADDLGGTWRDNTYPGLTCDIPSHLYSFSFRPWRWSRRFPPREEILAYLQADPLISPLHAAHSGLPPLLIQAGTEELLAPDAGLLAASASAAGVDVTYTRWPRMWHDFTLQAGLLAATDSAVAQAAWFVSKVTGA